MPIGSTRGNPSSLGKVIEVSYDRSADIGGVVSEAVSFQFDTDNFNGFSLLAPTVKPLPVMKLL